MTRRSTGPVRQLVPQGGDDWQEDEAEREVPAGQDDEADEDEAGGSGDSIIAPVDLDEADDIVDADPDLLAAGDGAAVRGDGVDALLAALDSPAAPAARAGSRRASGNARRQLEEYWERRRIAREIEDLEDFEV
jgi:hypothetical protein